MGICVSGKGMASAKALGQKQSGMIKEDWSVVNWKVHNPLFCGKHCANGFLCISSFKPHSNPMRLILVWSIFLSG